MGGRKLPNIKVIASDQFRRSDFNSYSSAAGGRFTLSKNGGGQAKYDQYSARLYPVSEERVKQFGGAAAFGAAGAVLFGPVGLLAGVLLGGNKTRCGFIAVFKDGTRALLEMDSGLYKKLIANEMDKSGSALLGD